MVASSFKSSMHGSLVQQFPVVKLKEHKEGTKLDSDSATIGTQRFMWPLMNLSFLVLSLFWLTFFEPEFLDDLVAGVSPCWLQR